MRSEKKAVCERECVGMILDQLRFIKIKVGRKKRKLKNNLKALLLIREKGNFMLPVCI